MGIKPKVKDSWSKATINDMLKNPIYTGKVFFGQRKDVKSSVNGQIVTKRVYDPEHIIAPGKHEAIIDDKTFLLAASIRKERKGHTVPSTSSLQNPLSGLVYCQKCGALMTRLAPNKKNLYSALKCPNRYCDNISTPLFLVERQVLQYLQDWLKAYEMDNKIITFSPINNEINIKLETIKKLEAETSQLKKQLNRAYDLLEQNVYTIDIFRERQNNLTSSITAAESQLDITRKELKDLYEIQNTQNHFAPKVRHLLDSYRSNSIEQNNSILKELIERITYEKNERNTRGKRENCNFSLRIYPRISL